MPNISTTRPENATFINLFALLGTDSKRIISENLTRFILVDAIKTLATDRILIDNNISTQDTRNCFLFTRSLQQAITKMCQLTNVVQTRPRLPSATKKALFVVDETTFPNEMFDLIIDTILNGFPEWTLVDRSTTATPITEYLQTRTFRHRYTEKAFTIRFLDQNAIDLIERHLIAVTPCRMFFNHDISSLVKASLKLKFDPQGAIEDLGLASHPLGRPTVTDFEIPNSATTNVELTPLQQEVISELFSLWYPRMSPIGLEWEIAREHFLSMTQAASRRVGISEEYFYVLIKSALGHQFAERATVTRIFLRGIINTLNSMPRVNDIYHEMPGYLADLFERAQRYCSHSTLAWT